MAIDNVRLHEELLYGYRDVVKALASVISAKDPYISGHSQRVKQYALMGVKALSLPWWEIEAIECAGILHDVGKIGIADATLHKPGPLTTAEWAIVRRHPWIGASIVTGFPSLGEVGKLIAYHHEHYDGTGYPHGLSGDKITIGARLLAVADTFDTLISTRSYQVALSVDEAILELRKCSGKQLCPVAVEAFIRGFEKWRQSLA